MTIPVKWRRGESPFLKRQEGLRFEYGFLRHIPCPLPKTNITTHAIIYIQHAFDLINFIYLILQSPEWELDQRTEVFVQAQRNSVPALFRRYLVLWQPSSSHVSGIVAARTLIITESQVVAWSRDGPAPGCDLPGKCWRALP